MLAKRNPRDWGDGLKPSLDEELDRREAEANPPSVPSHKSVEIPLLAQAVRYLVDQGVDIPLPAAEYRALFSEAPDEG
jgi:hypothetical protein